MKRKLLIFSLVLMMLFCQAGTVYADKNTAENVIEISNEEEFLVFAEACKLDVYSIGKVVELKADLNLYGTDFTGIPYFDGTFWGNGYTISGLRLEHTGSQMGLFRYIGELGVVSDLNVRGTILPEGSQTEIGGIAGVNYGIIQNCNFYGTICGQESVGAIAGVNKLFGQIIDCSSNAIVLATNRTGGIAGVNEGTIEGCINESSINIEELEPVLEVEGMDMGDLNIVQTLINRNNTGGIAGKSSGTIKDCSNYGTIGYQHTGYNVGGIAGYQSGIIKNCENFGEVLGRKDVGGIAGQAGPYIESEYLNEKITQLKNSVNRMERTMGHLEDTIEGLPSDMGISTDEEGKVQLERRELTELADTMKERQESVENDMNSLMSQMNSLTNQVNRFADDVEEEEKIEDISSLKNAAKLDGVISECINHGKIEGDLNVGGIAGTMNIESTDDPEADTDIKLDVATKTELNDVILSSVNYGNINGKKNCIGGIVGLQQLGLVYDCEGYGSIAASAGSYIGGVAGQSGSTIEKSYSVSDLSGKDYIGGIAGEGAKVLDSLSMVTIESAGERLGAITGYAEEDSEFEGNYFVKEGYDGIDNISYAGIAEPVTFEEIMQIEGIPEGFKQVKVTFMAEDEVIEEMSVPYGYALTADQFPVLEDRKEAYAAWPEDQNYTAVRGNVTIEAEYIPWVQSISAKIDGMEKPFFIVTGKFYEGTKLSVLQEAVGLTLGEGQRVLYHQDWTILSEKEITVEKAEAHFYVPEDTAGEIQVWIAEGENWTKTATTMDGSYVVAELPYEAEFAVIEIEPDNSGTYVMIVIAAVVLILVISFVIVHNKRRKKAK